MWPGAWLALLFGYNVAVGHKGRPVAAGATAAEGALGQCGQGCQCSGLGKGVAQALQAGHGGGAAIGHWLGGSHPSMAKAAFNAAQLGRIALAGCLSAEREQRGIGSNGLGSRVTNSGGRLGGGWCAGFSGHGNVPL